MQIQIRQGDTINNDKFPQNSSIWINTKVWEVKERVCLVGVCVSAGDWYNYYYVHPN